MADSVSAHDIRKRLRIDGFHPLRVGYSKEKRECIIHLRASEDNNKLMDWMDAYRLTLKVRKPIPELDVVVLKLTHE